jgi:hypothetical protein
MRHQSMTLDLNEFYGVTVFHAEWIGPRQWRARAHVFLRDTAGVAAVDQFFAYGGTMSSADNRAIAEAERRFGSREKPADWNNCIGGVKMTKEIQHQSSISSVKTSLQNAQSDKDADTEFITKTSPVPPIVMPAKPPNSDGTCADQTQTHIPPNGPETEAVERMLARFKDAAQLDKGVAAAYRFLSGEIKRKAKAGRSDGRSQK